MRLILLQKKLDDLAVGLNLTPYDDQGAYTGKLFPVSLKVIEPVHMICPASLVCGTASCKPRSLVQVVFEGLAHATRKKPELSWT